MIVLKRRLIFWLLKAYLVKWWKVVLLSFVFGLLFFILLLSSSKYLLHFFFFKRPILYGVTGNYKVDTLPTFIVSKLSYGLTSVTPSGDILPGAAKSWVIKDHGKTYEFFLKDNVYFSDGQLLTSEDVNYDFTDVVIDRPDRHTVIFHLKDAYSPFLVTVSHPIFKKDLIGVGDYKINTIDLNDVFVSSMKISSLKNPTDSEEYIFYPTNDALKIAFGLGEISDAIGLSDLNFNNTSLTSYPNAHFIKNLDQTKLVTLFYNTEDPVLSDKKIRDTLSYGIPDTFPDGERAYFPYPPNTWYYPTVLDPRKQDYVHAQDLLTASSIGGKSPYPLLRIKTLAKYKKTAVLISNSWKKLGIRTKIEVVDMRPDDFQIYLGDFILAKDPDQYTLWHSGQINNITRYKNLRIDKLLEDGRKTTDRKERQSIYAEFQKYLLDDSPATFLYFPYEYDLLRK